MKLNTFNGYFKGELVSMKRQSVVSSNVVSVGYDLGTKVLEIEFKGGKVYKYPNVAQSVYLGLMSASSIGQYFAAHIKNAYSCIQEG
jgi:hypothetical protein